jgi:hypothetical protein
MLKQVRDVSSQVQATDARAKPVSTQHRASPVLPAVSVALNDTTTVK